MAAHQAPPSLGFSRQEHWSGLPFPSPMHESKKWKWSRSVVSDSLWPHGLQPTRLLHPWDFPARVLEWDAITFSKYIHLQLIYYCVSSFYIGLCGPGHIWLPSLYAGSNRWQWLGLCLSVSTDYLLLVQTPGIHRKIHSNTQRNPAGTEHAILNYMDVSWTLIYH